MLKTIIHTKKYTGIDPAEAIRANVEILNVAALAVIHETPKEYQGINYWMFTLAFTRAHSPDQVEQVMSAIPAQIKAKVLQADAAVQKYFSHDDYDVLAAYQVAFGTLENAQLVAVGSGTMKMQAGWLHIKNDIAVSLMETYHMLRAMRTIDEATYGITTEHIAGVFGTVMSKPSLTMAVLLQHDGELDVATYLAVLEMKIRTVSNGGTSLAGLGITPDVPAVESFVGHLGRPATSAFGKGEQIHA